MVWTYSVVCSSNMNRSMEAHHILKTNGFDDVCSHGTGTNVRLPGPSIDKPNVFDFGTPYTEIHRHLKTMDEELYTKMGLLKMLERNINTKTAPQRWQDETKRFDIVITFEERVFDAVVQDLQGRTQSNYMPTVAINLETRDTAEDAAVAGQHCLTLCKKLEACTDVESGVAAIADEMKVITSKPMLYSIAYT